MKNRMKRSSAIFLFFWIHFLSFSASASVFASSSTSVPLPFPQWWTESSEDFFKEAWDENNDPLRMEATFDRTFANLKLAGGAKKFPWPDFYWPSQKGGIAYRWNWKREVSREKLPFYYSTYTQEQIKAMSSEELAALSPAEKYDIVMGKWDYPTVQNEKNRTHPGLPTWFGLCHGLAPASILFPDEPKPIMVEGPEGLKIPFGSSDIKGLMTFYMGEIYFPVAKLLGSRCEMDFATRPDGLDFSECQDINAGAFHVVLGNLIGKQGISIIGDVSRDWEVWNHPIYYYSSTILGKREGASPGAAPGTLSEVELKTEIRYASGNVYPQWGPLGAVYTSKFYQYRLELDKDGFIIGGAWITRDRPDFLWVPRIPKFFGYYQNISSLYQKSIQ